MLKFYQWFCCCFYTSNSSSLANNELEESTVYFQDIYVNSSE